jgi:hypothetical protein
MALLLEVKQLDQSELFPRMNASWAVLLLQVRVFWTWLAILKIASEIASDGSQKFTVVTTSYA